MPTKWIDTIFGFTGENESFQVSCNIEQNRVIVWPLDDPIEQISIELESPIPLYTESMLTGLINGLKIFEINLTGEYDYDIRQLQAALHNFIAGLPAE
jgi:hypothetical protein